MSCSGTLHARWGLQPLLCPPPYSGHLVLLLVRVEVGERLGDESCQVEVLVVPVRASPASAGARFQILIRRARGPGLTRQCYHKKIGHKPPLGPAAEAECPGGAEALDVWNVTSSSLYILMHMSMHTIYTTCRGA